MGNTQIDRTGLGYIKRRKSFDNEKKQNRQKFSDVIKKAASESLTQKQCASQCKDSDLSGAVVLKDISWHTLLKSTP